MVADNTRGVKRKPPVGWNTVLPALAGQHQLIRYEDVGVGEKDAKNKRRAYTANQHSQTLFHLIQAMTSGGLLGREVGEYGLIGFSMSCHTVANTMALIVAKGVPLPKGIVFVSPIKKLEFLLKYVERKGAVRAGDGFFRYLSQQRGELYIPEEFATVSEADGLSNLSKSSHFVGVEIPLLVAGADDDSIRDALRLEDIVTPRKNVRFRTYEAGGHNFDTRDGQAAILAYELYNFFNLLISS